MCGAGEGAGVPPYSIRAKRGGEGGHSLTRSMLTRAAQSPLKTMGKGENK